MNRAEAEGLVIADILAFAGRPYHTLGEMARATSYCDAANFAGAVCVTADDPEDVVRWGDAAKRLGQCDALNLKSNGRRVIETAPSLARAYATLGNVRAASRELSNAWLGVGVHGTQKLVDLSAECVEIAARQTGAKQAERLLRHVPRTALAAVVAQREAVQPSRPISAGDPIAF